MKKIILLLAIAVATIQLFAAEGEGERAYIRKKPKVKSTDANIVGHVTSNGDHIPFASVAVKGTAMGTVTDATGHFQLVHLPVGTHELLISVVGYRQESISVSVDENYTSEVKIDLEEDVLKLDEVVVSADRSSTKRVEAPVIVNTIAPKLFQTTQSLTLGEGLNFSPGLRLENNCQNCGFSQVRMNGMEGPYSQILINSRPIFSGLAGVYGLELIPTTMIERVEVVRGGGSALFGSNAIAGTINIILKEPTVNSYELGVSYGLTGVGVDGSGGTADEYSLNFNTTIVSDDDKTGFTLYGFKRERKLFDANGDSFSELSKLNNLTLGTRFFHRFSLKSKIAVDFFTIKEKRDGGNKVEYPLHERDIAEAVTHDMQTAAINFDQFIGEKGLLSIYGSGQFLNRDSYYGAAKSLSSYGLSKDRTYNFGAQYKTSFGNSSLVSGIENTIGNLKDTKLGYPDYANASMVDGKLVVPHVDNTLVADQTLTISGAFAQYDVQLNKTKLSFGGRFDHYEIKDKVKAGNGTKSGNVFSPRLSVMQEIVKELQARVSYSQGYRAPQIFDEDLHIETSESRQVLHENDPNLKQETSESFMASLDFNGLVGTTYTGLLIEAFYTHLKDPFRNEIGTPDENGTVIYTRKNADEGAKVKGINIEFKLKPVSNMSFTSGFTVQSSKYDVPEEFFNERRFFRTPNNYGYMAFDWDIAKEWCINANANYTGSMLVPYHGTQNPDGELRESDTFFDFGLKVEYTTQLSGIGFQCYAGVKNLFNSYQSDFDYGVDRDPAYIYGPFSPRSIYFGIKLGNLLSRK